jgi:hypothetical protein
MRWALVAVALVGCGEIDWETREGWVMEGDAEPPRRAQEVLDVAQSLLPCRIEPWGGWIEWVSTRFDCAGVTAEGCFVGAVTCEARIKLVGRYEQDAKWSALPHEIGHYVHARCDGDYSEEAANDFARQVREAMPPIGGE